MNMYVGEVGFAYVGIDTQVRILKVDHQTGRVYRPLTRVTYHNGLLYVSDGGRVSTVDMKGIVRDIIVSFPGLGDHYVDGFAFGLDGRMYFGIGQLPIVQRTKATP